MKTNLSSEDAFFLAQRKNFFPTQLRRKNLLHLSPKNNQPWIEKPVRTKKRLGSGKAYVFHNYFVKFGDRLTQIQQKNTTSMSASITRVVRVSLYTPGDLCNPGGTILSEASILADKFPEMDLMGITISTVDKLWQLFKKLSPDDLADAQLCDYRLCAFLFNNSDKVRNVRLLSGQYSEFVYFIKPGDRLTFLRNEQ